MRRWPALILAMFAMACDPRAGPTTAPTQQINVFASTYPLADIARQVGGGHVRVDWVIDLGDPLVGFIPSRDERDRMIASDLILLDGPRRTEGWATQDLLRMQALGRVASVEDLPIVRTMPSVGLLQLDPAAARAFALVLVDKLAEQAPTRKAYFADRAQTFIAQLDAILRAHPNSVFGRGRVVVLDDTLAPLLDRFSIVSTLVDANALNLSASDIDRIRFKAKEAGSRTVLLPLGTPPGTLADLQTRLGLRIVTIDPLGFANYDGHATYLDVLNYNLDQLKIATQE